MVESLHDSETQLLEKEYMEDVSQNSGPPQTPDRDSLLMPQSMQSIIKVRYSKRLTRVALASKELLVSAFTQS